MIETIISTSKNRRFDRRQMLFIVFSFCMVTTLFFLIARGVSMANAGKLDGFRPGNIMSDYVMGNYKSMTESEIQAFLKSKNSCNNTNIQLAKQYSNYQYHIENGHFVCMADERFDGETAAHIIYQAAQDYKINPQVLIVLLQKEQSLVTDTWPNHVQYRAATGYGCPDTAACSKKYYGFKNQVRRAAELFRTVLNGGWTNYPLGNNYVQYSPNAACGGTTVKIENLATSALYRYTPYQPNAASLAAGYGRGNDCSAYGNRNFYLYFLDWFGNPQGFSATNTNLPSDDYLIVLEGDYSKVLQLDTDSKENGVKFMMASRDTADTFRLQKNASGTYTLIDLHTNKAVNIPNAQAINGVVLNQHDSNNSSAQQWKLYDNGDGTYSIASAINKELVLTIDMDEESSSYKRLILSYYNYSPNQSFRFVQAKQKIVNGEYYIGSKYNNKVFDVHIAGNYNIWGYSRNNTPAQRWQVTFNSEKGLYSIRNALTNRYLTATAKTSSSNVSANTDSKDCKQLWYILQIEEGYYELVSSCSGLAIDYAVFQNNNIQLWSRNNTTAQRWKFNSTSNTPTATPSTPNTPSAPSTPAPSSTPAASQRLADGQYYIISAYNTRYVFDLHVIDRYNLWGYPRNNTLAQRWKLTYKASADAYTINSAYNNRGLDISSIRSGTNVFAHTPNSNCSQLWRIIDKGSGNYEIVSKCSDKVAIDYAVNNNHNIQLWSRNNTLAQKWRFVKI